jgi:exonuclease SbcC
MIPIKLRISGFTSYRKPVEIDFSGFDLACISGPNGAGKSSLLDAITYALYGEARRRDEAIINTASTKAEVQLDFEYESQTYRIVRSITRGKGSQLDFMILNPDLGERGTWKVLTEQNMRATQAKIQSTLRLDYETFVNASFFLQGKADSFATQRPADRKKILSSILGLDQWEVYHEYAKTRIRDAKTDLDIRERKLAEIQAELDQEPLKLAEYQAAEQEWKAASADVELQTARYQQQLAQKEKLEAQQQTVSALGSQLAAAQNRIESFERQKSERMARLLFHQNTLARAEEIRAAYDAYNQLLERLRQAEAQAEQFRPIESELKTYRQQLEMERQRLATTVEHLQQEEARIRQSAADACALEQQRQDLGQMVSALTQEINNAADPESLLVALDARKKALHQENGELKARMQDIRDRIEQLANVADAVCPLCGQPLTEEHRAALSTELTAKGTSLGDQHRANKIALEEAEAEEEALRQARRNLEKNKSELLQYQNEIDKLDLRLQEIRKAEQVWQAEGAVYLAKAKESLEADDFLPDVRVKIAEEETRLAELGYDARAHQQLKTEEEAARPAVDAYNRLQTAQSAVEELQAGLADLSENLQAAALEKERLQAEYDAKAAELAAAQAGLPDISQIEAALNNAKVTVSRVQMRLGGIRQQLATIEQQKQNLITIRQDAESIRRTIRDLELVQKAFSKDGVPAMLIEQAIPELEEQANDILSRLSDHTMGVSFPTQREFKDTKRSDKRETLDIRISAGGAVRDYETFSGGEAFRINFAIRLALSRVLAKRAGAKLQTLVIDEGFGNQDAQGRQRLVEAINLIRQDFRKILIITHIEELKDFFPDRIEVTKTPEGSQAEVLVA